MNGQKSEARFHLADEQNEDNHENDGGIASFAVDPLLWPAIVRATQLGLPASTARHPEIVLWHLGAEISQL
jgi:hypothetical protein